MITVDWENDDCETIIPSFYEAFTNAPRYQNILEGAEYHAFFNDGHNFLPLKRKVVNRATVRGENGIVTQDATRIDYASAALLTSEWWFNYSHFVLDVLPMLRALEDLKLDALLVSPNQAAEQLLAFFDVEARLHFLSSDASIGIANLWLVSPSGPPSIKPGWVVNYLREAMLPKAFSGSERVRLWINRHDSSHRQLISDNNLGAMIEERGFTMLTASESSIAEQVDLFSRAVSVAGVHGAGFTNAIFCPESGGLLEFFNPYWLNGAFRIICSHLNIRWAYEVGKAYRTSKRTFDRDVALSSDAVIRKLDQFITGKSNDPGV